MTLVAYKNTRTHSYKNSHTAIQCMSLTDVHHLEGAAKTVDTASTSRGYAKATAHRPKNEVGIESQKVVKMLSRELNIVRSIVFHFHSIWFIIMAKLRIKNCQKVAIFEYKIGTGNNGKPMPIKMH